MGLAGGDIAVEAPLIVGNAEHRFLALEQLREKRVDPAALILEPIGRNTAPALTLAALAASEAAPIRCWSCRRPTRRSPTRPRSPPRSRRPCAAPPTAPS
jgi:Mannose-1-phosphate guanylyltransferase